MILTKPIQSCAPMEEQTDSIVSSYAGRNKKQLLVIVCLVTRSIKSHTSVHISDQGALQMPSAICGDLDSVSAQVRAYYESKGAHIHFDSDQDSTDLDKCLHYISNLINVAGAKESLSAERNEHPHSQVANPLTRGTSVAIFGSLGGRADQALALLHRLYKLDSDENMSNLGDLYLILPDSIIFVLGKGRHVILTPVGPGCFDPDGVGIVPLDGRPVFITSRGLKYEMKNWKAEFGVRISTSNSIVGNSVELEVTGRVIFTICFNMPATE